MLWLIPIVAAGGYAAYHYLKKPAPGKASAAVKAAAPPAIAGLPRFKNGDTVKYQGVPHRVLTAMPTTGGAVYSLSRLTPPLGLVIPVATENQLSI